jgi:hypothetical protein
LAFREIQHNGKPLMVHKAVVEPHFNEKTVLVTSTWDYVSLWLRRNHKNDALFFWEQARHFHHATTDLPKTSSPLTAYYCFLNATKALLLAKGIKFSDYHGVSGKTLEGKAILANEEVVFHGGGILAELAKYLGEPADKESYSLKDVLFNLVYIHRAFDLTFKSTPELFVPIRNPQIVRSKATYESWFCAELEGKYANERVVAKLAPRYERDHGITDRYLIRARRRFRWEPRKKAASLARFRNYHRRLRCDLYYIHSPQRLWYIKRSGNVPGIISRSSLTLTFAAMHRLSELSRYAPDCLARHFEGQHNWLLSEFITVAPMQFIDEVSSELTGREFMIPGRAASFGSP